MKISSKQEKEDFLKTNITGSGSYALVTYENRTEAIWISKYTNWTEGRDWFLESPCELYRFEFKDTSEESIRAYAEELYEPDGTEDAINNIKSMLRDGWLYEIENFQTMPYLPNELDNIELISEIECLDWMLKQPVNGNNHF